MTTSPRHGFVPCVTLIGMPSAGKTKIGRKLAKHLDIDFVDIDERIVRRFCVSRLQELVDTLEGKEFIRIEGAVAMDTVKCLTHPTVIATGGSMVYHEKAMELLKERTTIIHLKSSYQTIARRLKGKLELRGIVLDEGETLKQLYDRRMPLYEKWADRKITTDLRRSATARRLALRLRREGIL